MRVYTGNHACRQKVREDQTQISRKVEQRREKARTRKCGEDKREEVGGIRKQRKSREGAEN